MPNPSVGCMRIRLAAVALVVAGLAGCGSERQQAPASPVSGAAVQPGPAATEKAAGTVADLDPALEVKPFPGFGAPEITARDVLTGESVQLSALKGQVVMINFWATWCPPCREEMPAMERFHQSAKGKVRVVAVAADGGEPPERLAAFAKELGLSFSVVHDAGAAAHAYRAFGLPTSLFVDQNGVVRVRFSGPLTEEQMAAFAAETAKLGEQAESEEETEG